MNEQGRFFGPAVQQLLPLILQRERRFTERKTGGEGEKESRRHAGQLLLRHHVRQRVKARGGLLRRDHTQLTNQVAFCTGG